jgi:hypothetical protein
MTFKHKYQKNNVHLEQFVTQTLKSYVTFFNISHI